MDDTVICGENVYQNRDFFLEAVESVKSAAHFHDAKLLTTFLLFKRSASKFRVLQLLYEFLVTIKSAFSFAFNFSLGSYLILRGCSDARDCCRRNP